MLKYLGLSTLCDTTFVLFMVSWFITRHFFFVLVIKSTIFEAPRLIPFVWDPEPGHYMPRRVHYTFSALLVVLQVSWLSLSFTRMMLTATLQAIQLMWFFTICRVAYKVVSGEGAEDTRSDTEG